MVPVVMEQGDQKAKVIDTRHQMNQQQERIATTPHQVMALL
jgi:hypothetical protein